MVHTFFCFLLDFFCCTAVLLCNNTHTWWVMEWWLVGGYCYCCTAVYWCTVVLTALLHMVDSWGLGWVRYVGVGWAVGCIYRPSQGGRGVGWVYTGSALA